ncbi:MAG: glycosyltransferase family 2 protein [Pseudomonadota bacterium]
MSDNIETADALDPAYNNTFISPEPLVSIMLVNWNTREMTLEALRSVYEQTVDIAFEVILVDNGSHDGSAEAIAREFPQLVLMAEEENHGFAKATNISVERAQGKYVLLLNTDTLVLDRAIERLVAFAQEKPEARIWGGRTLFEDRSLNPDSCFGRITPWSAFCYGVGLTSAFRSSTLFNPEGYGNWQRDTSRHVDIVQGSFMLIERAFWNELGGFDLDFFMYSEEADLCARARALGARPAMTPAATIVHYGGRSTKNFPRRMMYIYGGRIGLIQRHFGRFWRPLGIASTYYGAWWRAMALPLIAKARPSLAQRAQEWREIWDRRELWKSGPPQSMI